MGTYRKNIISSFTEKQNKAYEQINNIISLSGEDEVTTAKDSEPKKPELNKKMFVVGFVMCVFMYAFIYLLYATFNIKASSAKDAAYYSGTRVLGEYCYLSKEKGIKSLLHSNGILKIRRGKNLDHDYQINAIKEEITAICKKRNICSFDILSLVK